jgi:superfamily I DNA/RNA helicase
MDWKQAFSASCDASGPAPQIPEFGSSAEVAGFVSETIRNFHGSGEYPLSEMAVLYLGGRTKGKVLSLPLIFRTKLESRGIMTNWIAEDYRTKRSYDITTDMVSISTIDSAKGLDYACVFLIGLDELDRDDMPEAEIRRLVYTGITRARHRLFIPCVTRTRLMEDLLAAL